MTIQGIHHITLIGSDPQRTIDFYTRVLGQRLVKQTINFDDPGSYHLYFGDEVGSPGSVITFFAWPGAPKGHWGIGGTHHFAMQVPDYHALLMWKRRLTDLGLKVDGPLDRHYFTSIYFQDPDGVIIEIATNGPGPSMRRLMRLAPSSAHRRRRCLSITGTRPGSQRRPGQSRCRRSRRAWRSRAGCTISRRSGAISAARRRSLATCLGCGG
jgi:catechol 2,3-dioxygenase-like lactoylglutathione lyase family enzyme